MSAKVKKIEAIPDEENEEEDWEGSELESNDATTNMESDDDDTFSDDAEDHDSDYVQTEEG